MTQTVQLGEVVEAIDRLNEDEREALYDLIKKRRTEANENRILAAAEEIRKEYEAGNFRVLTPEQIVNEMFS